MAQTPMRERIFFISIAVLFLLTSVGVSVAIIWQMHQDSQNTATNGGQSVDNQTSGKLQGTKLANFTPVAHIADLQTIDQQAGTGQEVKAGDTVTANYTGAVAATGVIFQSSLDSGQPVPFPLDHVIEGWQKGIPGMKVGGKRRLLIPAAMAYGANPPQGAGIPANADLVFDVEVVKVGN